MSKFNELYDLLKDENDKKKNKKKSKAPSLPFSKAKFSMIAQAFANDPDYETTLIKLKNDEYVEETVTPVKDFRKQFIEKVLVDHGIDKQQAANAANNYQYSLKQIEALHPFVAEEIEQYMRLGYTFKFNDKKDFSGSIHMRDIEAGEKEYRDPSSGKPITVRVDAHKTIVKKGGAPKICKHKIG